MSVKSPDAGETDRERILSRLLLLPGTLSVIPSVESLGAFTEQAIQTLPGVVSARVCTAGRPRPPREDFAPICAACEIGKDALKTIVTASCGLMNKGSLRSIPLRVREGAYGYLNLIVGEDEKFVPYAPFVENIAGVLALIMENGDRKERMERITGRLEQEAAERAQAEEVLRESEDRNRDLVENSQDMIYTHNLEGRLLSVNQAAVRLTGYSREKLISMNLAELIAPEARHLLNAYLTQIKTAGRSQGHMRVRTAAGENRYWEYDNTLRTEGVDVPLVRGMAHDITERERAEKAQLASLREKEVLLREIHHRVKNNMQVISSLFNLQAGHTLNAECREVLKEAQTRIRSMSLVHEKLYRSHDLSKIDMAGYIRSLALHLFQVYSVQPDQIRLETEFEEVPLDINSAMPCGLLLNELISNALKHAFPEGRTGMIKISLRPGTDGAVELRVADDGIGLPAGLDFYKAESFGLQIVRLLAGQLDARIELDRTNGTAFSIMFSELKYSQRI